MAFSHSSLFYFASSVALPMTYLIYVKVITILEWLTTHHILLGHIVSELN